MKTRLILFLSLISNILFSQVNSQKSRSGDLFLNYISKMYFIENISYEAFSRKKGLFDPDTAYSRAQVTVKKLGDSIIFLQITNFNREDELLLFSDSAWYVSHEAKELRFVGKGIGSAGGNYLSEHFPVSLYTIDTMINQVNPFWKTVRDNELYDFVSIDISSKPEEVTDLQVEVMIKHSDSLIYSLVQDAGFKGITARLYQEESFRNYKFPVNDQMVLPAYFYEYRKNIPGEISLDVPEIQFQDTLKQDLILTSIELYDMEGNTFNLPGEGLVFIDLWYVGCFPCMKAAPVIEKLYNEYKNRVRFYSVNEVDSDKEKIRRFRDTMGISFPVLLGGKEKLAVKVNNSNAYPAFFLMDASDGRVIWSYAGFNEDLDKIIKEIIDQNL